MKIFLSTHGKMASGMKSSLDILAGNSECITAFDAHLPGSEATVEEEVEKFFSKCEEDETKLLLSDLYGGSVNQSLAKYCDRKNTFLIAGINLGLLLELSIVPNEYTKEELLQKIESSKNGMKLVEIDLQAKHEESFF